MSHVRSRRPWLCLAAAAIIAGCGTTEITSRWHTGDAGPSQGGAGGGPASTFDDRRLNGTVSNDAEYFSLRLRIVNPDVQRIVMHDGITWWFDSEGGAKRSFGIRYPLSAPRPAGGGEAQDAGGLLLNSPGEIELFAGEKEHQRMSILATGGIEAAVRWQGDTLVYDLRVPLTASAVHPFGIGAGRGSFIGVGAVTTATQAGAEPPIGRQDNDGEGGFGGGRTGGGSRPSGGPRTQPLNLWIKVRLATAP